MKRLYKFIIIIVFFILFMIAILLLASVMPPSTLTRLQQQMDMMWWTVSMVRWLILVVMIVWVIPWYLSLCLKRYHNRYDDLTAQLQRADEENAQYETKVTLENYLYDTEKMLLFFQSLNNHRICVAGSLIGIEALAVQLPHWI